MRKEDLDILLKKYYDGLSTCDEEKLLRDFFSGNEIPAGYETEAELFRYYSDVSSVPPASDRFEDRIITSIEEISPERSGSLKRMVFVISGIAAGFLIFFGSWFFFDRNKTIDTFSDPEIAYAETMKILYEVSSRFNQGTAALEPVSKMNMTAVKGLDVLARSRETLEKNLNNLGYIEKAITNTELSENKKNDSHEK